jgi:hypothetical protein
MTAWHGEASPTERTNQLHGSVSEEAADTQSHNREGHEMTSATDGRLKCKAVWDERRPVPLNAQPVAKSLQVKVEATVRVSLTRISQNVRKACQCLSLLTAGGRARESA